MALHRSPSLASAAQEAIASEVADRLVLVTWHDDIMSIQPMTPFGCEIGFDIRPENILFLNFEGSTLGNFEMDASEDIHEAVSLMTCCIRRGGQLFCARILGRRIPVSIHWDEGEWLFASAVSILRSFLRSAPVVVAPYRSAS